jgi:hypothetical protein
MSGVIDYPSGNFDILDDNGVATVRVQRNSDSILIRPNGPLIRENDAELHIDGKDVVICDTLERIRTYDLGLRIMRLLKEWK